MPTERKFLCNVYVVLLNPEVVNTPQIKRRNPKGDPLKPCVYVGLTGLRVDRRLQRGAAGRLDRRRRSAGDRRGAQPATSRATSSTSPTCWSPASAPAFRCSRATRWRSTPSSPRPLTVARARELLPVRPGVELPTSRPARRQQATIRRTSAASAMTRVHDERGLAAIRSLRRAAAAIAVAVAAAGAGQVPGSASLSAAPCRGGRPFVPGTRGGRREIHHPVAAQPASTSTGRSRSSQASRVRSYAGVEDDQDVRVAVAPVPGGDRAARRPRGPGRRSPRSVVGRAEPDRVQRRVHEVRPGSSAATNEYGQPGIICAFPLPRAVAVAEQPLRAGLRVRPQPVAHIGRPAGSARPPRPAAAAHASARRSRAIRTRPQFTAS